MSDFNFVFGYGIGAKNVLDTFEDTYTKDMISAPSVTIEFNLTDEDLSVIFKKLNEIDFFSYPEEFTVVTNQTTIGMITPYETYYFKVTSGSETKEVRWENEILWRGPDGTSPWSRTHANDTAMIENSDAAKLYELVQLIRNIIESKPEIKELPEPVGAYL